MKTEDFSFNLPGHLIAQTPTHIRTDSRMMVVNRKNGSIAHSRVSELCGFLNAGDVLVFNDSRVRKSRFHPIIENTGRAIEVLIIARLCDRQWTAIGFGFPKGVNTTLVFPRNMRARLLPPQSDSQERILEWEAEPDEEYFESWGAMPLPPYITRSPTEMDEDRYQTVYGKVTGSVACPTAGLHFTHSLLDGIDNAGVLRTSITLHVGLGTFLPVRTAHVEDHRMHEEHYTIPTGTAQAISNAKLECRRVVPVGTTSLRCLESAAQKHHGHNDHNPVSAHAGTTDIFLYPGCTFKVADALFTNFHTPKSTLFILVSAFGGVDLMRYAYTEAIKEEYRFFSYGDAMLIV